MLRKLAAILVIPLAALGIATFFSPGAASADVDDYCGSTGPITWPKIDIDPNGGIHILGWYSASYVNSTPALFTDTYRVWHVTFDPTGLALAGYERAFAARCSSTGSNLSEVDLTRQPPPLSSFDQRCGTTDFLNGSSSYHYLGTRISSGDRFRYWGTAFSTPLSFGRGVTAARCD